MFCLLSQLITQEQRVMLTCQVLAEVVVRVTGEHRRGRTLIADKKNRMQDTEEMVLFGAGPEISQYKKRYSGFPGSSTNGIGQSV